MLSVFNDGLEAKRLFSSRDKTKIYSFTHIKDKIDQHFLYKEYNYITLESLYEILDLNNADFIYMLLIYTRQYAKSNPDPTEGCIFLNSLTTSKCIAIKEWWSDSKENLCMVTKSYVRKLMHMTADYLKQCKIQDVLKEIAFSTPEEYAIEVDRENLITVEKYSINAYNANNVNKLNIWLFIELCVAPIQHLTCIDSATYKKKSEDNSNSIAEGLPLSLTIHELISIKPFLNVMDVCGKSIPKWFCDNPLSSSIGDTSVVSADANESNPEQVYLIPNATYVALILNSVLNTLSLYFKDSCSSGYGICLRPSKHKKTLQDQELHTSEQKRIFSIEKQCEVYNQLLSSFDKNVLVSILLEILPHDGRNGDECKLQTDHMNHICILIYILHSYIETHSSSTPVCHGCLYISNSSYRDWYKSRIDRSKLEVCPVEKGNTRFQLKHGAIYLFSHAFQQTRIRTILTTLGANMPLWFNRDDSFLNSCTVSKTVSADSDKARADETGSPCNPMWNVASSRELHISFHSIIFSHCIHEASDLDMMQCDMIAPVTGDDPTLDMNLVDNDLNDKNSGSIWVKNTECTELIWSEIIQKFILRLCRYVGMELPFACDAESLFPLLCLSYPCGVCVIPNAVITDVRHKVNAWISSSRQWTSSLWNGNNVNANASTVSGGRMDKGVESASQSVAPFIDLLNTVPVECYQALELLSSQVVGVSGSQSEVGSRLELVHAMCDAVIRQGILSPAVEECVHFGGSDRILINKGYLAEIGVRFTRALSTLDGGNLSGSGIGCSILGNCATQSKHHRIIDDKGVESLADFLLATVLNEPSCFPNTINSTDLEFCTHRTPEMLKGCFQRAASSEALRTLSTHLLYDYTLKQLFEPRPSKSGDDILVKDSCRLSALDMGVGTSMDSLLGLGGMINCLLEIPQQQCSTLHKYHVEHIDGKSASKTVFISNTDPSAPHHSLSKNASVTKLTPGNEKLALETERDKILQYLWTELLCIAKGVLLVLESRKMTTDVYSIFNSTSENLNVCVVTNSIHRHVLSTLCLKVTFMLTCYVCGCDDLVDILPLMVGHASNTDSVPGLGCLLLQHHSRFVSNGSLQLGIQDPDTNSNAKAGFSWDVTETALNDLISRQMWKVFMRLCQVIDPFNLPREIVKWLLCSWSLVLPPKILFVMLEDSSSVMHSPNSPEVKFIKENLSYYSSGGAANAYNSTVWCYMHTMKVLFTQYGNQSILRLADGNISKKKDRANFIVSHLLTNPLKYMKNTSGNIWLYFWDPNPAGTGMDLTINLSTDFSKYVNVRSRSLITERYMIMLKLVMFRYTCTQLACISQTEQPVGYSNTMCVIDTTFSNAELILRHLMSLYLKHRPDSSIVDHDAFIESVLLVNKQSLDNERVMLKDMHKVLDPMLSSVISIYREVTLVIATIDEILLSPYEILGIDCHHNVEWNAELCSHVRLMNEVTIPKINSDINRVIDCLKFLK